ncbi:hypothetical protein AURDEDRAFT_185955 [Auricularia subglabra TFB-10046 SS5]|nr:hypothetical protein AURDEDRAFT_185955 [Auricularia subglabra TFB-10046 SS5]
MSTKLSVTIDDVCPLIQYTGAWRPGSQVNDPYHSRYSDQGTFTITQSTQAFATINFNGTRIQVYGGKRENHGLYSTSLDGDLKTADGESKDEELFRQTLFDSGTLSSGPHTLVLRDASTNPNPSFSYFDIDFAVIETEVERGKSVQLDDTDGAFTYSPANAWDASKPPVAGFNGGTGHSTSSARATATLHFTGSAVDVFGLVCPACGQYTVSLDGGSPVTYSAYNSYWTKPQTMLYMGRGLGDGDHVVTLTSVASALNIDYAIIYGTNPAGRSTAGSSPGGSSGQDEDPVDSPQRSSSSVPVGAIVGAVVGGVAALILCLALVLYIRRRVRKRESGHLHPISPAVEMSGLLSPLPQSTPTLSPFTLTPNATGSGVFAETPPAYASAMSATPGPGTPTPVSPTPEQRKR